MSDVFVDPEKLREFARLLKGFSREAEASVDKLIDQLGRLANDWRDDEFAKFAAHVRRAQVSLSSFAKDTARTVPQLEKDADTISEYQKIHLPE
jgi:uncharacterized protein YukE